MPEGKRIPPPPIFPEDDQSTAIAQDRPFYSGKKRRIPPPPLFRDDEQPSLLGEDLYDIFTTTGRTLSEGLADLEIGPGPGGRPAFTKNPIAGGAKILRSVGEAVAAPFGLIDRLLRTNSITTPIAEGAAMPFELAAGAVRGGEKLIDVGLRGAGVPESVMNLGMDPQKAAEAATALSELNQIAAQFAVPLAGKKIGGKTAGKIIKMQEEASRPIFRPSNREPVDYIAPESRQLYPPRNQRFEQRPGQPVRDIKAGVPLRKVPPLLPENLPLRKPEFEPVRTFEVGPEGGAKAIKSTPAPLTSRIDKALSDVAPNTKARIKRKIEAKDKLSVGEKNILTQRDRNLFDDMYEPKGLPQLPEGGIPAIDNNIVFDINDYRSGESFGTVRANDPNTGKTIGKVDFSEYGGNVYVKMVEVTPEFRRQGIATKMYDRIKQEYPKAKIERFGDMSTDEGAAFRESLKGEAEKAPKPDPTTIKTKLISLRDQVNKGRYRGRVADITEAELLARRNGFDFSYDPGTLKYNVISAEGKKLKKVPEVKMSDNAPNPTLLENINPETRTRIQDILDEVGEDINIESLTKPQIEAAIKDIRIDKGKEASRRAQMLIDELLKAEAEGIVGVVSGSVPGVGKDIRGINVNDLLEQKYEREGIVGEMGSGLDVPVPEVNIPEVQRRRANSFTDIRSLEEELRRVNLVVKSKESLSPSEQIELGEYYDALLDRRGGLKPVGEPLSFDKTAAGEQGSFAKLEQAKMPPRKPSGLSYEQQVEGTMFEKPKTPGAPQEEMFRVGNPDALAQQIVNIATTGEGASIEGIARARELAEQSKDIFTGAQREEIASFLNDLESKLKKPGAPVVLTAEDIVREQSGLSKVGARSGKSIEELYPSKPKPQSWQGAVSESSKRLKEKGLSPDRPQGNLPSGLDPTTLIDPKKVKYIIDPIIKKATSDARKMIIDQRMRPEQFPFEVRSTINTLLSEHPDFRGLSAEQKRAIFNHVKDVTKNLVFNPVVGEFQTQEGRKFREEMRKAQGGGLTPAPIEGGRIISEPMKRENINPTEIFSDGMKSFTRRELTSTMGEYVKSQGSSGESLIRSINRDYRESAQWAGRLEVDYRVATKKLSNQEFDEFVTLADEGGTTRNANVADALKVWDKIRTEIADRAMKAELEIATFDRAKGDFVKVPFKPMENYFPHEFDITEIKKAANREKYLERIAERYKVPKSEAEWIFNKWVRSRIEVKYGHLEHARDFDIGGWKRSRDVIPAHIERATRRITQAEIYGNDYAIAQNYIEQILNSGGDYKAAQTLFDRVVGREDYNRQWSKIQRSVNSWQVATKLTLLSILNPTQLNNAGLIAGWKSLGRQFGRQFTSYTEMREFAERAGSILGSTLRMHQKEALSLDGIGSKMMKLTGVTAEERWLRTLSTNIIADSFKRDAKKLSNTRLYSEMQRKLDYLNLSKDINLAEVRERGNFTEAELLDIGYEGARKTQFLGRPQDLPKWLSNQDIKVFTQFKSFVTQQTKLINDAVINEARRGNLKPLIYLATMFPLAGEAALDLKSLIQGRDRPDNLFWRYAEDMTAVGAFGIISDMMIQAARDPQGLLRWAAGPTVSDVSELGYGLGQAGQGKYKPLARFGARQIPFPVIQQAAVDALRTEPKKRRGITF